jgi:hypothetical protein
MKLNNFKVTSRSNPTTTNNIDHKPEQKSTLQLSSIHTDDHFAMYSENTNGFSDFRIISPKIVDSHTHSQNGHLNNGFLNTLGDPINNTPILDEVEGNGPDHTENSAFEMNSNNQPEQILPLNKDDNIFQTETSNHITDFEPPSVEFLEPTNKAFLVIEDEYISPYNQSDQHTKESEYQCQFDEVIAEKESLAIQLEEARSIGYQWEEYATNQKAIFQSEHDSKIADLESNSIILKGVISELQEELQSSTFQYKDINKELESQKLDNEKLRSELMSLRNGNTNTTDQQKSELSHLSGQIESLNIAVRDRESTIAEKDTQHDILKSEFFDLSGKLESLNIIIKDSETRKAEQDIIGEQKQSVINQLTLQCETVSNQEVELRNRLETLLSKEKDEPLTTDYNVTTDGNIGVSSQKQIEALNLQLSDAHLIVEEWTNYSYQLEQERDRLKEDLISHANDLSSWKSKYGDVISAEIIQKENKFIIEIENLKTENKTLTGKMETLSNSIIKKEVYFNLQ